MKKLVLAVIALAFAFAVSSCCDQSYCPSNMKCKEQERDRGSKSYPQTETPYRWDKKDQVQPGAERQHRRW